MVSLAVALAVVLALFLYGLGSFGSSASTTSTLSSTETTSYETAASSVLSSASGYAPSGYEQGPPRELSAREPGLVSGGYALFSNQAGALANMTILVFDSQASAQSYVESVISNAKALSGYSNANSTLSGFQRFGVCYGYVQSAPEGGGSVANGVCTKGNVYIQVHLATLSSLPSAEGDMSGLVGAAYRGLG